MAHIIRISRGCEYALTALLWIAAEEAKRPLHADEISEGAGIPSRFAKSILANLAVAGLLQAHRGAVRGYTLARPPSDVTLLQIVEACDGPINKPWCLANREKPCRPDDPCGLHDLWVSVRDYTCDLMASKALSEINPPQHSSIERKTHDTNHSATTAVQ